MGIKQILERCGDKNIVNMDIIKNPDRDITNIIFDCYNNLKNAILVAYTYDTAGVETMFDADYKAILEKWKKEKKAKYGVFKRNYLKISVDIENFENNYMVLKLKYIINPDDVSDKFKLISLDNTIQDFLEETSNYQNVFHERLEDLKTKRNEEFETLFPLQDYSNVKEIKQNLFVQEQNILIPIIDKTGKYIINNIPYYGVHNCTDAGRITSNSEYSFKIFRNGKITTTMVGVNEDDVLYIRYFGEYCNPFHIMYDFNIADKEFEELVDIPDKDSDLYKYMYKTYLEARKMTNLPKNIKNRASSHEDTFRSDLYNGLVTLIQKLDVEYQPVMLFEHLGKLEEAIYSRINKKHRMNGDRRIPPTAAVKRVNLDPLAVVTLIKSGAGDKVTEQLFVSSTTEPNPFDLFQLFYYVKTSQHTETTSTKGKGKNKGKSTNGKTTLPEREKWLKYNEMAYIGQFTSKNGIGKSSTIHFHLPSDRLIRRRTR